MNILRCPLHECNLKGKYLAEKKRQTTVEFGSGPYQWRTIIKRASPWPLFVDCVDCSIMIPNQFFWFSDRFENEFVEIKNMIVLLFRICPSVDCLKINRFYILLLCRTIEL